MHDGCKNNYSFVKDGVKIVLAPTRSKGCPKPLKEKRNVLFSKFEILKELKSIKKREFSSNV